MALPPKISRRTFRRTYDPHLDQVLNFYSTRARIEKLIDDALASGDIDRMRDALTELKPDQPGSGHRLRASAISDANPLPGAALCSRST